MEVRTEVRLLEEGPREAFVVYPKARVGPSRKVKAHRFADQQP